MCSWVFVRMWCPPMSRSDCKNTTTNENRYSDWSIFKTPTLIIRMRLDYWLTDIPLMHLDKQPGFLSKTENSQQQNDSHMLTRTSKGTHNYAISLGMLSITEVVGQNWAWSSLILKIQLSAKRKRPLFGHIRGERGSKGLIIEIKRGLVSLSPLLMLRAAPCPAVVTQ